MQGTIHTLRVKKGLPLLGVCHAAEKLTAQLSEALKVKQSLTQINPELVAKNGSLGSVIYTNKGNFYIAASIGKVEIANELFFAISPASPIGKLLLTKLPVLQAIM